MHLLLHGRQCLGLADNQLDLGRPAQRRQLDLAIRRGVAAGQQARQHPGIPGLVPGTEQGDASRRSLEPCPAAQYAEVGMAGTDQQQVIVGHRAGVSIDTRQKQCAHGKD
ncbi:hypothetical protein D3C86_1769110 [compost metagenome]